MNILETSVSNKTFNLLLQGKNARKMLSSNLTMCLAFEIKVLMGKHVLGGGGRGREGAGGGGRGLGGQHPENVQKNSLSKIRKLIESHVVYKILHLCL